MIINNSQMNKMHEIQVQIFKSVIEVCEKLNLKYFLVHGSLLGAVTINKFMPLDDDIDIAMPRADYEIFISKGNKIIDKRYFIQSSKTDKNYPIPFGKVRANNTTYIAELLRNIDMNHGMFIDVFPIDFCEKNSFKRKFNNLRLKFLSVRVSKAFAVTNVSIKTKILLIMATALYPSQYKAIEKREKILQSSKTGDFIRITGGKVKENRIPAEWFKEFEKVYFEGIESCIPKMYREYLTQIYGNYKSCTLLENKQHGENTVEINAYVFDPEKPYTHYFNRG